MILLEGNNPRETWVVLNGVFAGGGRVRLVGEVVLGVVEEKSFLEEREGVLNGGVVQLEPGIRLDEAALLDGGVLLEERGVSP